MRAITMLKKIFISYSYKDEIWVSDFVSSLKESGVETWFDIHELTPGDRWEEKLQQALRESSIIVVIISENSFKSPWTFFELGAAIADKKQIIPVLVGDVESKHIPLFLRQFHFLRESSPGEAGKRIAKIIDKTSLGENMNRESLIPSENQ